MEDEDLLGELRRLLNSQRFAVVATSHNGHPYTNLVSFALTDDLRSILFTTSRKTRKFRNIMEDPRTSVLVDNRENKPSDITDAQSVAAMGMSAEVIGAKQEKIALFLDRHPYMADFANNPDFALVEVHVEKFQFVRNFQDVEFIDMNGI